MDFKIREDNESSNRFAMSYLYRQGAHLCSAVCDGRALFLSDYVRIMCADYVRSFLLVVLRADYAGLCVIMCGIVVQNKQITNKQYICVYIIYVYVCIYIYIYILHTL